MSDRPGDKDPTDQVQSMLNETCQQPNQQRRAFVLGSITAAAFIGTGLGLAPGMRTVFRLDARGTCSRCKACKAHSRNKFFATLESVSRAHPHCKCTVVAARISEEEHKKMFSAGLTFDVRRNENRLV